MTRDELIAFLVQRLDGHDGSHWQRDAGPIDYDDLFDAVWWLGWKATQSTGYVDPSFALMRAKADAATGKRLRHFLPYHWLSSITSPSAQADHYLDTVIALLNGEGAMLDAEEKGITVEKCLEWLEFVENETQRPSNVYTGIYVAGGTIWRSPEIRQSQYGPRTMHLAAYVTPANLADRLVKLGLNELAIHARQWTSDGPCPGIVGRADLNTIHDVPAYDRVCGVVTQPTTQEAIDMSTFIVYKGTIGAAGFECARIEPAYASQTQDSHHMVGLDQARFDAYEEANRTRIVMPIIPVSAERYQWYIDNCVHITAETEPTGSPAPRVFDVDLTSSTVPAFKATGTAIAR